MPSSDRPKLSCFFKKYYEVANDVVKHFSVFILKISNLSFQRLLESNRILKVDILVGVARPFSMSLFDFYNNISIGSMLDFLRLRKNISYRLLTTGPTAYENVIVGLSQERFPFVSTAKVNIKLEMVIEVFVSYPRLISLLL